VSLETLEEMFESLQVPDMQMIMTGELSPGREITMIHRTGPEFHLQNVFWGRPRDKGLQINARSERWEKRYKGYQPCVIPASAYFEWNQHTKAKVLFEAQGHPLFFLAGVCMVGEAGKKEALVLTKPAESELMAIHPRMPIVFDLAGSKAFLKDSRQSSEGWATIKEWRTHLASDEQLRLF
jgi:putative SOS response-associated peptidase YedK